MDKRQLLASLPSVDEILKSPKGLEWQQSFPRRCVLRAIRETLEQRRQAIRRGDGKGLSIAELWPDIQARAEELSSFSLQPLINATGIVIHTNLGRSVLPEEVLDQVKRIACGYSNLEYDLGKGRRGKRYAHVQEVLNEITGAEASLIVNNNAAAVLVCLSALAAGQDVIVSRGELVEIGGSFRIPDVMAASGTLLREVGTTNKTHLRDYEGAITAETALLLKVHQSNYRIIGFTGEVGIEEMSALGRKHSLPVMFDLGSGCLIDLKPYGVQREPTVQEVVRAGVDLVTFSGDKLLGGPQGGVITGKRELIERIARHPLMSALRVDKLTLAAFEATLMYYLDEEKAKEQLPTLKMLLQHPEELEGRAQRIASAVRGALGVSSEAIASLQVREDFSQSGGGALPEVEFKTYVAAVKPLRLSVNRLEERLRRGRPPVIARIQDDLLLLDARTVRDHEIVTLVEAVRAALAA